VPVADGDTVPEADEVDDEGGRARAADSHCGRSSGG
jgi:hypothetical protein